MIYKLWFINYKTMAYNFFDRKTSGSGFNKEINQDFTQGITQTNYWKT